MFRTLLLLSCASGALGLAAGAAEAQTATGAAASAAAGSSVTEIVVHAERREQTLQRVPVAVSVFTGPERDVIGINTVQEVTNFAPGFTYDPGDVHAYIRGVGRQSINVTNDSRVATYEDDFYVYSPYELDKSDLFLSQEQIERGPQNVGGKNADAGSIDMISVRPTDKDYAEARFNVGNYGVYNFEAALSGPIAPGLDFRIAGYDHNQDQGYQDNVVNHISDDNVLHEWYIEPQIEWKPNDNTDLWIRGFLSGWSNRGDAGGRAGFESGDWDETALQDPDVYPGAALFVNPNFGYAADPGSAAQRGAVNPIIGGPANLFAAVPVGPTTLGAIANSLAGLNYLPTSVSLITPGISNNPSISSPWKFGAILPRDVSLIAYNGINGVFKYDFPDSGVELRYITGYQQYNYHLDYSQPDTDVTSFTLGVPALGGIGTVTGLPALVVNPLSPLTYIEDDEWWSHEFVLQSTNNSPLQWTAGVFYYQQHYINPIWAQAPDQPQFATPLSATPPGISPHEPGFFSVVPNPNNYIFYQDYDFTYQDAAGYGQISYQFNDQFKVTGNIRYTWDHKYGWEENRDVDFSGSLMDMEGPILGADSLALDVTDTVVCLSGVLSHCNSAAGGLGRGVVSMGTIGPDGFAYRQLAGTTSGTTGGIELEWTPTPSILAYARYDRGYEAMSFNAGYVSPEPETQPEFINSFQVGYKQNFGTQLLFDADAFYYDYENLQVPLSVISGGVVSSQFLNIPKSTSAGVELEAFWTPTRNWSITGSYSFDYTEINTGCSGTVSGSILIPAAGSLCVEDTSDPAAVEPGAKPYPGQNFAVSGAVLQSVQGDPLPNAPEHKLGIDVAYTWRFEPGNFTLSGAFAYRSSQVGTMIDRSYYTAPGWTDTDFRALWRAPGDKYEIIAYVKNVFDTTQYIVGAAAGGLAGNASRVFSPVTGPYESSVFEIAPPRTFGMEVRYKFY